MLFAYRELMTLHMVTVAAAIACSYAVMFAMLGPFFAEPFLSPVQRIPYVVAVMAFELVVFYSALVVTMILVRFRTIAQIVMALLVMTLVVAVPSTAMVHTLYAIAVANHLGTQDAFIDLPKTYLSIVVLLFPATILMMYVLHLRVTRTIPSSDRATVAGEAAASPEASPEQGAGAARQAVREVGAVVGGAVARTATPFFERLPTEVGDDVVYVKGSGHYLDVVTSAGSAPILMRLCDAVADLGDRGMQIHRSYWVAHRHATELVRRDHRVMLRLTSGRELPTSRSYLPEIRRRLHREQA